jgi:hypothetical protein
LIYIKMGTNASVDNSSKKHTEALQEIASDECVEETASVLFCDPCNSAGEENEAVGYCVDCKECLCSIKITRFIEPRCNTRRVCQTLWLVQSGEWWERS